MQIVSLEAAHLLIFTQPSWDGYLLLYSIKSSTRGTVGLNDFLA
jgi:hypothetical protein